MKKRILAIILSALMILSLTACGGTSTDVPDGGGNNDRDNRSSSQENSGALSGTYEGSMENIKGNTSDTKITFSGNSFALAQSYDPTHNWFLNDSEPLEGETREERTARLAIERRENIEKSISRYSVYEESDEYELIEENASDDGFISSRIYKHTRTGTYSLTDTELELVFSDGGIVVHEFTSTENTITLDGTRFTRKP